MSDGSPHGALAVPNEPVSRTTRAVLWLLAINAAVFFTQLTVLNTSDVQLALGFQTRELGHEWWTIGTYMFVHGGFWQLALNMYALWTFGSRLETEWGTREFLRFYFFCGLGGWLAHLAFVPGDSLLVGATAPVLGVMLASVSLRPRAQLFVLGVVPVTAKWLAIVAGTASLAAGVATSGATGGVAYLAHAGGLAAGWLYFRMTAAVSIDRLRQAVSPVPEEPDDTPPRAVPRSQPPRSRARERDTVDDVVARSNAAVAKHEPASRQPRTPHTPRTPRAALDEVLDKISAHGLDSLTSEERTVLSEESKRRRTE